LRPAADRVAIDARLFGSFVSAWVLFPLVLLATSTGCGLLVRRIARGELHAVLVAPVGFALLVAICAFATSYGWLAPAAGPIAVAVAAVGLVLEARGRRSTRPRSRGRAWLWPTLAAAIAFAALGGPVFLTGEVGWTGYTRIVDIAFQMDFAQHLADAGRVTPPNGGSSYNIVTTKLLGIGYPGGSQATLGAMAKVTHTNVAWAYQAFLAFAAAMGALAIYSLLGRITANPIVRCVGAAVAIQPNILYGYALEAGIKELTTASLLLVVVALLAERLPGDGLRRSVLPLAVAVSGAFGAFSLGIAPWLGLLLAGAFAASVIRRSGRLYVLESWALFAVVAVVISLPGLITAAKLASVAGAAVGGVVNLGLGNLAVPVSRWASAGVYLTGDYRFPVSHPTPSHIFDVLVIGLAVVGVVAAAMRRRWALVVLGVSTPIALGYFIEHSTAWIQLKAFTITAAFALTLAFAGAATLQRARRRWVSALGSVAVLAVAGSVLYGNAIIYHQTSLAPGARYHDLAAIAGRYAGQGPTLDPYFDEYAEYFLRGEKGSTLVDPANFALAVRAGVPLPPGGQAFAWDLNQLEPSFIQTFHLIIQPRSPAASRPPSNYDLVERTRYFDVWRRDRPSSAVLEHYPLSNLPHERTPALCRVVTQGARRAGPGALIAYAQHASPIVLNPVEGIHPDYWRPIGLSALAVYGAGSDDMKFAATGSGSYSIWLQGSVGRPLDVYIDGRRVAGIAYEERYPGQFLLVGKVTLDAGSHTLRLVRGGGSLHPGSGDPPGEMATRTIGAIVLAPDDANEDRVHVASASSAARICAAPVGYEWLEVLHPGAAPPNALPAAL
jgi:hypothetical protein